MMCAWLDRFERCVVNDRFTFTGSVPPIGQNSAPFSDLGEAIVLAASIVLPICYIASGHGSRDTAAKMPKQLARKAVGCPDATTV